MTHKIVVKRAALWLRNSKRCAIVISERVVTACSEQPDVIGWYGHGGSVLIECKISRHDFHADRDKRFRIHEETGVGQARYFAAPRGVLSADDMPDGWGLLEIGAHHVKVIKEAAQKEANKENEVRMLVSCIRRLELAATVFVMHENETDMSINR